MPAVMKLINNLNSINTCFSNGYELRGSMGNRQTHNNGVVMNGGSHGNHLTRSATRNRLKEPLTVECNGYSTSVSVRSDGILVEQDSPRPLCRSKSKSCSQLAPLSPDIARPRRHAWRLPSCLLGTTAEDTRALRVPAARSKSDEGAVQHHHHIAAHKTEPKANPPATHDQSKSNNAPAEPCRYHPLDRMRCKKSETIAKEEEEQEVEERKHKRDKKFLEDNKEYYKVEVLSTKLRSTRQYVKEYESRRAREVDGTTGDSCNLLTVQNGDLSNLSSDDATECRIRTRQSACSGDEEKPRLQNLKLRQCLGFHHVKSEKSEDDATPVKRARPNKITMVERLNMEADKFMFGDPRRELEEQESSPDSSAPRRKRKSHVELFLIDNLDYYKFQLSASRLRNGHESKCLPEETVEHTADHCKGTIRIDFDAVKYSFEMGIQSELWYQVFLRSRSRNKQSLWENKVPHQSKILLPFERKFRPGTCKARHIPPSPPPPPPPPPELDLVAPPLPPSHPSRRRKRRCSSILEDDSRPRKSPRCHASTQAILSSTPLPPGLLRRYEEEDSTPAHEPDHFPECCEYARTHPYSCDVRRLVDKLAKQCSLNISQVDLCEVLRQHARAYYSSLVTTTTAGGSGSQPGGGDNSSECGTSSHLSSEVGAGGVGGGKRLRQKKRRINMTGWPCRPRRKAAGKIINYNENAPVSTSPSCPPVPPPSLSPACDVKALSSPPSQRKKPGRKKKANRYKY